MVKVKSKRLLDKADPIYGRNIVGLFYSGRIEKVASLVNTKNKRVLDIGCGYCHLLILISKSTNELYGININQEQIDEVNEILSKLKQNNINISNQDIKKTNFNSGFFDVIFGNSVFEHINELNEPFNETRRILNEKGTFILSSPIEGRFYNLLRFVFRKKRPEDHVSSIKKIEIILRRYFKIVKIIDYPFGSPLYRIFICKK